MNNNIACMKKDNEKKFVRLLKSIASFGVKGHAEEDVIYIEHLYHSMMELDKESLKTNTAYADDEEKVERAYCNDVSKEYHCLLKQCNPFGLRIDADDIKHLFLSKGEQSPWKYPDLVVHLGRNDIEKKNQMIVVEAKRFSKLTSQSLLDDLNKLIEFSGETIWGGNGFKYAVFILVGGSSNQLKTKIDTIFKEENCSLENLFNVHTQQIRFRDFVTQYYDRLSRIIIFAHKADKDVESFLLGDIL
jgi:hypothetical protein